ncbi:MAG: DUF839 domain-containing protein [Bacteroidia bacterium]|nr:DUF839 domain-containing protein [Bacteroidia bacterium]NNK72289.1 DUF839 domain-containing protein [Flavobacteriaceae bacterium]
MNNKSCIFSILFLGLPFFLIGQSISDFISVTPVTQTEAYVFPSSHKFQKIIESGDALTEGGTMPISPDFSGFVPISGSSTNGYLSINSESAPGGNTILDISFNSGSNLWEVSASEAVDFSAVAGTIANCSGTVTPWNTVVSCEEFSSSLDQNGDGYRDYGWNVEIDPATKTVLGKRFAMGNFAHENIVIHNNLRTVYQGADSNPGYLYKFVSTVAQDLSSGVLYVYSGSKNGAGNWIQIPNTTQTERNTTLSLSSSAGGTVFNGVEDVEIGPDGQVYLAVKGENRVYRFQDSDPIIGTTATMETYVGNMNYDITHAGGTTSVSWGSGNDNLAFDGNGNLWVNQDGGNHYIWVVDNGHTQASPQVRIFGIAPSGSESTGITFTPDFKYMFLSIQHPSSSNAANQTDADGQVVDFDKGTTLVMALADDLGETLSLNGNEQTVYSIHPNPVSTNEMIEITGKNIEKVSWFDVNGKLIFERKYDREQRVELNLNGLSSGFYFCRINDRKTVKILVE